MKSKIIGSLIGVLKEALSKFGAKKPLSILCSRCFSDPGLQLDSQKIGYVSDERCKSCGFLDGSKLTKHAAEVLASRFFVLGTTLKREYGAAPRVQFNSHRDTEIIVPPWVEPDVRLLSEVLGVGFFLYGPRMWMIGKRHFLHILR